MHVHDVSGVASQSLMPGHKYGTNQLQLKRHAHATKTRVKRVYTQNLCFACAYVCNH